MNLYLLADYGTGDLAWAEVEAALRREMPAIRALVRVELPPFDTWACSLALRQIALLSGPRDIIFHNVAPRRDDPSARQNNAGEPLLAGHSQTGTLLVGPGSGYSWSLAEVADLRRVRCSSEGSQFRSRDVFPEAISRLYHNHRDIWGESAKQTPEIPPNRVLFVDGYGNLKTSLQNVPGQGEDVIIRAGGTELSATVTEHAFSVPEGQAALALGSASLWEVFLRGGSAARALGNPVGGDLLEIE